MADYIREDDRAVLEKHSSLRERYGTTRIRTFREIFGASFAPGCAADSTLTEVLQDLDKASVERLVYERQTNAAHRSFF